VWALLAVCAARAVPAPQLDACTRRAMSEVSSGSSSSSSSSSSSDEDDVGGGDDFLDSIASPTGSFSRTSFETEPAAPEEEEESPPVTRLVPARSAESDGTVSVPPDDSPEVPLSASAAASDDAERIVHESTPNEVQERFNGLLRRYLEEYSSAVAAAAEGACRDMQSRVSERLGAMLADKQLGDEPGAAAAVVEQAQKRLDALCEEVGATATWQKHYELVSAGIIADNVAQLKAIETAAQSEAQGIARRTRLESKSKLELAEQVASQQKFNAVQSIQRTASQLGQSIEEQIKDELAAAAHAAERTEAELTMRQQAGKKAKLEAIESEEAAKMIKRKIVVIEDRLKQQRQHLVQLREDVVKKDDEIKTFENRLQALGGIAKLSSAQYVSEQQRKQHQRALSFQMKVSDRKLKTKRLAEDVEMLSSQDNGGGNSPKLPAIL
jgi:hypothetical protein